jgi:sugar phosphate isomerase/epimerase
MIKAGLASVTFRQLSTQQIIELTASAGLKGIEWGADVHVPHGGIESARKVCRLTHEAGLEVAAYGSYYRLGISESQGLSFSSVLDTAIAMNAPVIRVWAGDLNAEQADDYYWDKIISEAKGLAKTVAAEDIKLAFEYHENSLTNTAASTRRLLDMINNKHVMTFWQPIHGAGPADNSADLELLLDKINNVHVFHWWPTSNDRHLLEAGFNDWNLYLTKLYKSDRNHYAMIEFVKDNQPDNFHVDTITLKKLLSEINPF